MRFDLVKNSDGSMRSAYPLGGYTPPGGGGGNYDYSSFPVTHIVDPATSTNGTGSEISPLTVAQAMALNPVSAHVHCEWMPGIKSVDLLNSKWPAIRPDHSGSATYPIIHRARNPAVTTALQADRTRFVRNSGHGSYFGVGIDLQAFDYVTWDGFESLEYCQQDFGDEFVFSVWGQLQSTITSNIALRRCIIENGGGGTGSDNHGCVWAQTVHDFEIGDCQIGNNTNGYNNENASAIMFYDVDGVDIHHSEVYDSDGLIWFKGRHAGETVRNNRVRLSILRGGSKFGLGFSSPNGGTTMADLLRAFQNHIHTCGSGVWCNSYGAGDPLGVAIINNLIRACTSGFLMKPGAGGYAPILTNRNNILYQNTYGVQSEDTTWAASHSMFEYNYNNYFGNTNIYREGGNNRDWAYWTGTIGNEANGINTDPNFVNAGGGDYRLATGSNALDAGLDYLQLHGGSQSAAINLGPYISAAQDEVIGVRTA